MVSERLSQLIIARVCSLSSTLFFVPPCSGFSGLGQKVGSSGGFSIGKTNLSKPAVATAVLFKWAAEDTFLTWPPASVVFRLRVEKKVKLVHIVRPSGSESLSLK